MTTSRSRATRAAAALLVPLAAVALVGCSSGSKPVAGHAVKASAAAATTARPTPTVTPSPATPTASAAPLSAAQQRQVTYALTYWKNYNTSVYGNDNPNGGDCANFVSQTLIARGWTMNSTWYNHGQNAMSGAWAFVPSMYDYFEANAAALGLQQLSMSDRSQYAVGDVVMFWWKNANGTYDSGPDHVQVIDKLTDTDGTLKVEMASHNDDFEYRDLDNEITVEHPGAKFVVWHLTRDSN